MKLPVANTFYLLSFICLIVMALFPCGSSLYASNNPTQLSILATKASATNGNWSTNGVWSPSGVPGGSDNITISHIITANQNIAINGGSLTINSGGRLVDATGGTAYQLTLQGNTVMNVDGYVRYEGVLNVQNTASITVKGCDTLRVGSATFANNTSLTIEACGVMIVDGNLDLKNSNAATVNGTIIVNGNITGSNSAAVTGSGTLSATGTITSGGSSSFFGNQSTDCTVPPCVAVSGGMIGTLPVEMLHCSFVQKSDFVDASWTTASEINNDYFIIEHSINGISFEPIETIKGNGNSSKLNTYHLKLYKFVSGTNYYRIKQVDFNGKYEYHCLTAISINEKALANNLLELFPNPVKNDEPLKVMYNNSGIESGVISIFDLNGRELLSSNVSSQNSIVETSFLENGMYTILVRNKETGKLLKGKFIVNK